MWQNTYSRFKTFDLFFNCARLVSRSSNWLSLIINQITWCKISEMIKYDYNFEKWFYVKFLYNQCND